MPADNQISQTSAVTAAPKVSWAAGELYEPYVGRWSRLVARQFVQWLELPPQLDWLDVGCGTGALAQAVLQQAAPKSVTGIDPSPGFIDYAKRNTRAGSASFEVGDAQSLPVQSASFDVAVSGLVLNFVPNPLLAAQEMARAVRTAGTVAAYLWDYAGKMELMRYFWDTAVALDQTAHQLAEAVRFPICQPPALAALFGEAGLRQVQSHTIDVETRFRDFDDYWNPFLSGQAPAPAYAMSLDEEHRAALRERLRATLPTASDGSISLIARAWAVRGRKH